MSFPSCCGEFSVEWEKAEAYCDFCDVKTFCKFVTKLFGFVESGKYLLARSMRVVSAPFRYSASFSRKWIRMTLLSFVWNRRNLRLGANSCWHRGCFIDALGGVSIGENVIIGPYVVIHSANHRFLLTDRPIMRQGHIREGVVIGDDCWLGAHVTVLPGVRLGRGCVVGAGAVVTHSFPEFSVVAGVPAKVIRSRK